MVLPLIHSGVVAFSNQDITIKFFFFLKKKGEKNKDQNKFDGEFRWHREIIIGQVSYSDFLCAMWENSNILKFMRLVPWPTEPLSWTAELKASQRRSRRSHPVSESRMTRNSSPPHSATPVRTKCQTPIYSKMTPNLIYNRVLIFSHTCFRIFFCHSLLLDYVCEILDVKEYWKTIFLVKTHTQK